MRLLVFGPGYSASAAMSVLHEAEAITATARTPERAAALEAAGIEAVPFDGSGLSQPLAEAIATATHILVSIAPGDEGDRVLHTAGEALAKASPRSIVYLSTVGVYGDHGGDWVDEASEPKPKSRRSIARVDAENAWRGLATTSGVPLAVLRLSGIYGPGRNALVNLRQGTARRLVKPGQVFNRIHVDDIAAAVAAAFARSADGVFNVTDDEPAPPQDVVAFAAGLLGIEPPPEIPFEEADLSPMARSFYGENKRVRNERMKIALGVALSCPTYREGLAALVAGGEGADGE